MEQSERAPSPDENSGHGDERPPTQNNGSASSMSTTIKPSTVIPPARQSLPKYVFTISRSLKGKERAQDSEGEAELAGANLPTNRIETTLQVDSDGSYAAKVAINEARQSGLSQEQMELMARFYDPSNTVAESDRDESTVGSSSNTQVRFALAR